MNTSDSSNQSESPPPATAELDRDRSLDRSYPIVCIGASAGGLEAFTQLLGSLEIDTGMAFVLIQHLDPNHKSLLSEILSQSTEMPVRQIEDGMAVEPNCVYIIPPNKKMIIIRGILKLMPREKIEGKYMPIDAFLQSLAKERGNKAIAVILSGMDGDGTLGVEAIKAEGGITFAQCEETARYDSMPNTAVASGHVDFILPPQEIAHELAKIGHHPYVAETSSLSTDELPLSDPNLLEQIFTLLRTSTGADFTRYKHATIKRRIMRRLILNHFQKLEDYVAYLQKTPPEVAALYQDILIPFTTFFRDPESYEALKKKVFPKLMMDRPPEASIRIWIPGCSTGEEAYSMAICLLEFLEDLPTLPQIQIFATDINEKAIEKARAGIYPDKLLLHVSEERKKRFFVKIENGYQLSKRIRDMCVFAKQNVSQDPPFSKLDLISCRNMLIYMGAVLQKKVIPLFHYALKSTGFLMLGASEGTGGFSDLFAVVDKKYNIYSRKLAVPRLNFEFTTSNYPLQKSNTTKRINEDISKGSDLQKEADRIVLNRYAPVGVVIDNDLEIRQFRGEVSLYLEPAPGSASLNLLRMVRSGFLLDLRTAIHKAKEQNIAIRKEGLQIKCNKEFRTVNIEVIPFKPLASSEGYFLVLFEDVTLPDIPQSKAKRTLQPKQETVLADQEREILQLRQELASTREYLQSIIEEQEVVNEELKASSEEVLSSNEEFQSTNEELETAKEEIQATNEELNTINEELQHRNLELNQVNNDLNNLLDSVSIPIVMLGNDLCIRLFTPKAKTVLNILPTDIGRSIGDIRTHINVPNLQKLISNVIKTATIVELEVQDRSGHWYDLRIRPYKTADNRIEGTVMALVDIDALKRSADLLKEARDYARSIVETVRSPLVVLDAELRVKTANPSFYETFQVTPEETEQNLLFDLGNRQWDILRLRYLLSEVISNNTTLNDFEVSHNFLNIGDKTMLLNACKIPLKSGSIETILLAIEDITDRRRIEEERHQLLICEHSAREVAEAANRAKDEFLSILSHELRNPLSAILGWSKLLLTKHLDETKIAKGLEVIQRSAQAQNKLIEDILDISRITTGKIYLNVCTVNLALILSEAIDIVRLSADAKQIQLELALNSEIATLGDSDRLKQVFWNLLSNAIKFTPTGGRIEVKLEKLPIENQNPADSVQSQISQTSYAQIQISDNGIGIEREFLPYVFDRYRQAHNTIARLHGGLGLGLALVRYLVELHGGTVRAASPGLGLGTTITVELPLQALDGES
ncbi:chemotaxis protein CheB [Argonema antarcticum]|uniref:chemotaxis protein CheB n=1 Tax=Argonema antarcticum TaxID=2942763 RepID=UPI0020129B91|nr:chemotaxis protein CheB [Argonema antarcticum]MCL1472536.1 PAS domain-containing protein [Argonema antarcticum A004/B2]